MKSRRFTAPAFVLQILLFLGANWAGDQFVSRMNWPIWLDSAGTVFCAYLYGPFCGAVVGATSNLLAYLLYGTPWYYALISVLIGLITGFAARKKALDTLLGTLTACAVLAGAVAVAAYPVNLTLNGGSTGSNWGDAVIGFLGELGIPRWGGLLIGELYMELLDKLVILLAVFLSCRLLAALRKRFGRGGKDGEGGEDGAPAPARAMALIVAAGCCLASAAGTSVPARAEDQPVSRGSGYSDYVQTVYSTSNGLPCGEANDIAMTGDGVMWIGTYAGLYRYNGREFRWMDGYDSIRNVNCLYLDEEGRLWVGTNDNGVSILINEKVANVISQDDGLPSSSVKSIIKSSDGYYYIGTTGSMQILTLNCGLKHVNIVSEIGYADHLAADDAGNVAAVTNEGTLFLLRQGQIVSSRKLPGSQSVFKSCCFGADGTLLAATSGSEIYRFRVSRGAFELLDVLNCPGLQSIKSLRFMENGDMFVCADNGIAYFSAAGAYERVNTNNFNNSIDNMLVDYQGNLWFTSSRLGLLRLAPSDFRDVYSTAGLTSRVVNTVVQWNGTWYFGTDKGMDAVDRDGKKRVTDAVTDRFSGIRIRCMIVDSENHLWICTYGGGLVELAPDGTEYLYDRESGAFGNRARVVKQLRDGTVLAAGDTGLSFIRDHRVEHTIGLTEGNLSSMVLTLTELEDGKILAGTDGNGIAVIQDGKVVRTLTRANGLSSEVILRTVPDSTTGGVFVVTSNGLCYISAYETVRRLDNFPYYNNYDVWVQDAETLFVLSSAGIYTVNRTELLSGRDDLSYDLLDTRRGLNGSLTANAWTWYDAETGELYLPCDTGVFVLNTGSLSSGVRLFRMNVTGFRVDGELHGLEKNRTGRIPRGSSRLEILPEVINYTIQDPYVGYMLEGFDTDWTIVPQNSLNSIVYTNLPTGDFTFRLAVFDNSRSSILAERAYAFTKEKAMYDNSWFIVYILFVPMFTVFWLTWLLVKRHERKMEEQLALAERQVEMGKQTVIAIARTVDAKDERTSEHSKRVAIYSKQIARAYGLDDKQCRDIEWTAQMHDIGKISIPDAILNKNSRLTDEEYAVMKSHTVRGAEILNGFTLLDNVIEGAEYHHERYDGRGYPKGLKGEDIPLYARIIGVADAFDAMTANRVYRKQMDFSYVLSELEKGRGTQFDPQFVDILLRLIRDGTIDLNKIYHVSRKETEQAEKAAEAEKQEKKEAEDAKAAGAAADGQEKKEPVPADGTADRAGLEKGDKA